MELPVCTEVFPQNELIINEATEQAWDVTRRGAAPILP